MGTDRDRLVLSKRRWLNLEMGFTWVVGRGAFVACVLKDNGLPAEVEIGTELIDIPMTLGQFQKIVWNFFRFVRKGVTKSS